ncbi:Catalase [Folsomia candida]|uniref:Catalase n=2 Tax=Folsomia candida TaxID=158441 RepID=A0A226ED25_FOLCA|nr:Catalase [Folsomia candida]
MFPHLLTAAAGIAFLAYKQQDPSSAQLPTWGATHPGGNLRRATNGAGNPLPSGTSSLAVQPAGPLLMDPVLINKLASFNRERTPERVVHTVGQGAFGTFVVTNDVTGFTAARVFNQVGKETPVFVRFSNVNGKAGVAETAHDQRGFALRFYTKEDGNLDFAGVITDVFHISDPMLFPDVNRVSLLNPVTNQKDPNMAFDFQSLRPETTQRYIKLLSDNFFAPGSMRSMDGFSVNIFLCTNSAGVSVYCKFNWKALQKIAPLTDEAAISLAGTEPGYYTKDLYNAIDSGNYPRWSFGMQILTFDRVNTLSFNPFDITKSWREDEFPFIPIGEFILNRNQANFYAEIEQAAFDPANLVPGISPNTPDIMLAARLFSYKDSQRYRLGPNFEEIQVNRPISPVAKYERDGPIRTSAASNGLGDPIYYPNSFNGPGIDEFAARLDVPGFANGPISRQDRVVDNFSQVIRYLQTEVSPAERERMAGRVAKDLISIQDQGVRERFFKNCIYPLGTPFSDMVVYYYGTLTNGAGRDLLGQT